MVENGWEIFFGGTIENIFSPAPRSPPKTIKKSCRENPAARILPLFSRRDLPRGPRSRTKIIFKNSTLPTTNIFSKSQPHNLPQPNPQRRTWPQMDSLVMNFSSKWTILLYFTIFLATFHENQFSSLPHVNIVYRRLCVPTSETSCSSYFMKTNRQKPNFKLALSLQIQDQKNPGPLQTEAQRLTM